MLRDAVMKSSFVMTAIALVAATAGCASEASSSDESSIEREEAELIGKPAAPLFTAPARPRATKHPVVLAHGFHGSSDNSWSFNGVEEALEGDGHFVVRADVQTYNGTPARAATLVKELDRARREFCASRSSDADRTACFETTKVNIIAHSQGGLDARYAIAKLGYADHVASLTTIGTPHRGTPIGDTALGILGSGKFDGLADAVFSFVAKTRSPRELANDTGVRDAFFWLSQRRANDPTYAMPDAPGVYYQSWAGLVTLGGGRASSTECGGKMIGERRGKLDLPKDLHFLPLVPIFHGDDEINDGHIPVDSAKWGNFRGCLPADHLDLLGRPDDQHEGMSKRTGFDHEVFYRVLAHELAERGL